MQLDIRNRFLSLFSGYPHIPVDAPRFQLDYNDFELRSRPAGEQTAPGQAPLAALQPDDLMVGGALRPVDPGPDPWDLAHGPLHNLRSSPFVSPKLPEAPTKPLPVDPKVGGSGGGGGEPDERQIGVAYRDNGDQVDVRVGQINTLIDNDIVTSGDDAPVWPQHDVASLGDLAQTAAAQIPDAYAGSVDTPEAVAAALTALGDSSNGEAAPASLQVGLTVDGQAVATDAELPAGPADLVPELPTDTAANMAVVDAGGNAAANYGGMIDGQGAVGTLFVVGDSYRSDAIIQTNILVDESVVVGTADTAVIQASGNEANNVAEFVQALDQNPYAMGFFAGMHWNVDRIDGDYYDVRLVTQLNDMRDNDLVQQTSSDHYKFVETGSNEQTNLFTSFHSGVQYDLVIVTGNYYGANWIIQTNLLLNSDHVSMNAGEGGAGEQTVTTGANWLMNTATIADYSGGAHALTPDMQGLINALQGGAQGIDPSLGFLVPGDGGNHLNVLFITGNYYDLNVLQQTNIVSDSDVVQQTLAQGEAGYVSTGGNQLSNDALLVNLGPLGGQYVGGNQYSETVLVQTNIITQSADLPPGQTGVVLNDPGKLAPEAAALIQHAPAAAPPPEEQATAPSPVDSAMHTTSDPLASVLS